MRENKSHVNESNAIPDDALEALARCMLPMIRSYFESDEGKAAFAEWKLRQDTENLSGRAAKYDEKVRLAG